MPHCQSRYQPAGSCFCNHVCSCPYCFEKGSPEEAFFAKGTQSELIEDEFTNKEATALVSFKPGEQGKVEFKGTTWKAESENSVKEGETVIIRNKENFKLIVESKK